MSNDDTQAPHTVEGIVDALLRGELLRSEAVDALHGVKVEDLGFARIDHDRARRRGFPEVIFGQGKTSAQIADIFHSLAVRNSNVLCTRASEEAADRVRTEHSDAEWDPRSKVLRLWRDRTLRGRGEVLVIAAGTSDEGVAREALICAEAMHNKASILMDVGVAGIHRLLAEVERIRRAAIVIVVAGMEGALPSVVAGLVDVPVIAVPTSIGYGASFGGVSALLTCLNSCSSGVVTVNIDNGFGAAYAASLMNRPS